MNSDQLLTAIREKVDHPATASDLLRRLKIPREERATVKRLPSPGVLCWPRPRGRRGQKAPTRVS